MVVYVEIGLGASEVEEGIQVEISQIKVELNLKIKRFSSLLSLSYLPKRFVFINRES